MSRAHNIKYLKYHRFSDPSRRREMDDKITAEAYQEFKPFFFNTRARKKEKTGSAECSQSSLVVERIGRL